jgi:hypothetical protein
VRQPERTSIACGTAALAAYGGALVALIRDYQHARDNACPDGAPAPAAFWPRVLAAVVLAVVAFAVRPRRRDERGEPSGADAFAVLVVIAIPLATLGIIFGYEFTYACWE